MNAKSINVLIADDHSIVRIGLRYILSTQFSIINIDEASDQMSLSTALQSKQYSHLILDLQLDHHNMLPDIPALRKQFPELMILVYSMGDEAVYGRQLLKMGGNGFLSKLSGGLELRRALHLFLNGRNYTSEQLKLELLKKPLTEKEKQNPFYSLSVQEMAVFTYLIQGKRAKDIASILRLKSTTVATYKARIFSKLNIRNIVELQHLGKLFK